MKRFWWLLVLIAFLIILDQMTKAFIDSNFQLHESMTLIEGFFNFTYVRNSGAAWGMGANADTWVRVILFKIVPAFAVFLLRTFV